MASSPPDSTKGSGWSGDAPGRRATFARFLVFGYVLLIACPVRFWPLGDGVDPTWRFALNYSAAQGQAQAGDTVFTMGPLSYLLFPQNVGDNLAHGLLFQLGLWAVLALVFADIFFRAGFSPRNLGMFAFCFALATPMFWFAAMGTETLMAGAALILLVVYHLRGSVPRYVGALVLIGLLPMFKLTGAVAGVTALAGFITHHAIQRRWKAAPEAVIGLAVPIAVAASAGICIMPSFHSYLNYLRGSIEIARGYSVAMSLESEAPALFWAFLVTVLLVFLLGLQAWSVPAAARFNVLFLGSPLFLSFKHGFVREDEHVINFFCFAALAVAILSLTLDFDKVRFSRVVPLGVLFFLIWFVNVKIVGKMELAGHSTGLHAAKMILRVLPFSGLKQQLDSSAALFPDGARLEPELVQLIGDSPVASLSHNFANLAAARLRISLYPVMQRYAAYTPFLDELNAAWIRDQGPRFLVFNGISIDGRDPWAETPAMFLEVYRWYDSRLLGPRNLLLERRGSPRFSTLETVGQFQIPFSGEFSLPASRRPVLFKMRCPYSSKGQLLKTLFRLPPVLMAVRSVGGSVRTRRVIPDLLVSPVMGSHLPNDLAQFQELFLPGSAKGRFVDQVRLTTSQPSAYLPACDVELLQLAQP